MSIELKPPHFHLSLNDLPRTHSDLVIGDSIELASRGSSIAPSRKSGPSINPEAFGVLYRDDLSLIGSVHGKLERVLLSIPKSVFTSNHAYSNAYSALISKLPDHTVLDIVVHAQHTADIKGWVSNLAPQKSLNVYPFPDDMVFTVWAEDAYLTAYDDNGMGNPFFVEPFQFGRHGDSVIADYIAQASDIGNTAAPLYFQGGNVLVGDDFFLIGVDYPRNTLNANLLDIPDNWSEQEKTVKLREVYERYLDTQRRVYFPSTSKGVPDTSAKIIIEDEIGMLEVSNRGTGYLQPIFHIDMCVSLAGRTKSGDYEIFVGDPRQAEQLLGVSWGERSLSLYFDQFAEFLRNEGFKVERNPLALASRDYTNDDGSPLSMDDFAYIVEYLYSQQLANKAVAAFKAAGVTQPILREWYFATSNNLITEIDGDNKTVWMPEYGFGNYAHYDVVDQANRKLWENRNFEVHSLGDFHPFAYNLGAAHCITKYLGRDVGALPNTPTP